MARLRNTPKCPFCDKETHKAKYHKPESHQPPFFGDSFSHWESLNHECDGTKKMFNDVKLK